jgi:hypothetical protein
VNNFSTPLDQLPDKKINYDLILCMIIIFTATLQSIYFYHIKLAPFPLISFFLLIISNQEFNKRVLILILIFYFILIVNALFGIAYAGSSYYYNSLLGIAIGPVYFASFYEKFKSKTVYLEKGIYSSLLIHIIFFYIQFSAFYLFGTKINFLQMLTGEEARIEGVGVLADFMRCSGLCNEPASYSLFVNLLAFYLINIRRKINWMIALALLSTLLSFSVSGILFAALNVVYFNLFIVKGYFRMFLSMIVLAFFLSIFGYFYYDLLKLFLETRFVETQNDASLNTRFNDGFRYFLELSTFQQITGIGIGNYNTDEVSTVASGYMAIIVHLGYFFGFLFLIINVVLVRTLKYNIIITLFFFMYLASTMTFLNIHYWMFFAMTGLVSVYSKKSLNPNITPITVN